MKPILMVFSVEMSYPSQGLLPDSKLSTRNEQFSLYSLLLYTALRLASLDQKAWLTLSNFLSTRCIEVAETSLYNVGPSLWCRLEYSKISCQSDCDLASLMASECEAQRMSFETYRLTSNSKVSWITWQYLSMGENTTKCLKCAIKLWSYTMITRYIQPLVTRSRSSNVHPRKPCVLCCPLTYKIKIP